MNGTDQKTHTRTTDALAARLANVETVLAALDERVSSVATAAHASDQQLRDAIGQERTHRLQLADEQRAYVDHEDRLVKGTCHERWTATTRTTKLLGEGLHELRDRSFWDRVRWLVRGT